MPLGLQTVRGIAAPIEIFKLTGLLNAPASGVFRSGRRLTSLIGRSDQFAALEVELANTVKGDGRVVGVVGEAGIGKSRLCFEFAENCRRQGIRVFEARVLAHGRATPFQPVLELLRDFFGIRVKESVEVSRRRVIERFATLSSSEQVLPLLLEFLGLAGPRARRRPNSIPRARKIQLLDFVRTLARSGPRDTATVVLIEDLALDRRGQRRVRRGAGGRRRGHHDAADRQFQAGLCRLLHAAVALPADRHASARARSRRNCCCRSISATTPRWHC